MIPIKPRTPKHSLKIKEALEIEARALELQLVFPPSTTADVLSYTKDEYEGWAIHYWNEHGSKKDELRTPKGKEQLAGWLAREIYLHT